MWYHKKTKKNKGQTYKASTTLDFSTCARIFCTSAFVVGIWIFPVYFSTNWRIPAIKHIHHHNHLHHRIYHHFYICFPCWHGLRYLYSKIFGIVPILNESEDHISSKNSHNFIFQTGILSMTVALFPNTKADH